MVVFDPASVTVGGEEFVDDFPGEARRYVRRSGGYHTVLVNGQVAYQDGAYTEVLAGQVV